MKPDATFEELKNAPGRKPLSVIITTYNEDINIGACIESVSWADEILVVDSFSTDRTVEIIKSYPVKLEQREYFGSAAQKNWALDRVVHDWVLIVDADERVPEPLAREILTMLNGDPPEDGYYIRRENLFVDKVIRHSGWSTDRVIRLFRRDKGRYPNRRVHADLSVEGPTPELENPFFHYTFRSFDQYFEKFLNYAEWGAAQAYREGRSVGFVSIAGRPAWRFFRTYVLQLGILDGLHGLVLCLLQSFGVFLKYARLWEYRVRAAAGETISLPAFDDDPSTWQSSGGDD
ncbi:MAG: glycosyltransferase family 2 protein [Thermoanaerobaculia bacterium]|nr:glycosyltransferase family 2 protein [Thermoanaerobaculia bacterium]